MTQRDARALRWALCVRGRSFQALAAATVASAALAVWVQVAFGLIAILGGVAIAMAAARLALAMRRLPPASTVVLALEDEGLRAVPTVGESRGEALVAWGDVAEVREMSGYVGLIGAREGIRSGYIPRHAFDRHPEALAELRRRVEAARGVGDRLKGPGLRDGGDAGTAEGVVVE